MIVLWLLLIVAFGGVCYAAGKVKGYALGRRDEFRWHIQEQTGWGEGRP